MFFYIGKNCPLLTEVKLGLFLDKGWTASYASGHAVWYKGYSLDCRLSNSISEILNGYIPRGIWCVIAHINGTYKLFRPTLRGFPLYESGTELTNLPTTDFELKIDPIPDFKFGRNDIETVIQLSKDKLVQNCIDYVQYNDSELNLWCTGGIDSTSILAVLEYANIPYNLYVAEPKSKFLNIAHFEGTIQEYSSPLLTFCRENFWGYELLSVFSQRKILVTGFYGDEYSARGLWQIKLIAGILGKDSLKSCEPLTYMRTYLARNKSTIPDQILHLSEEEAKFNVCETIWKDYQMWHIDNTEVFSPYYDLVFLESVLTLEPNELFNCVLNATIQKGIIESTTPAVLQFVDAFKNTLHGRRKLFSELDKVDLKFCKNLYKV